LIPVFGSGCRGECARLLISETVFLQKAKQNKQTNNNNNKQQQQQKHLSKPTCTGNLPPYKIPQTLFVLCLTLPLPYENKQANNKQKQTQQQQKLVETHLFIKAFFV